MEYTFHSMVSKEAGLHQLDQKISRRDAALQISGFVGKIVLLQGLTPLIVTAACSPELPQSVQSKYYPELKWPILAQGSFETKNAKRKVHWQNASGADFNTQNAQAVFSFLELVSNSNLKPTVQSMEGQKLELLVKPHKPVPLEIFIVPENTEDPKWAQGSNVVTGAYTRLADTENINIEVIKITKPNISAASFEDQFQSSQEYANFSFLVEASQASIIVVSPELEPSVDGQEVFCVSMAVAIYARQKSLNYQQYGDTIKDKIVRLGIGTVPLLRFSEQVYNQIPQFQQVIY